MSDRETAIRNNVEYNESRGIAYDCLGTASARYLLDELGALRARLAAAEAVVDEARFVAKMRGDDYSCQVATTDVDAMIALEIRLSEYDAHLAPAPTKPEGGEVAR